MMDNNEMTPLQKALKRSEYAGKNNPQLDELCNYIHKEILCDSDTNPCHKPNYYFTDESSAVICFDAPEKILINHKPVRIKLELEIAPDKNDASETQIKKVSFIAPIAPQINCNDANAEEIIKNIQDLVHDADVEDVFETEIRLTEESGDKAIKPRLYLTAVISDFNNDMDDLKNQINNAAFNYTQIARKCRKICAKLGSDGMVYEIREPNRYAKELQQYIEKNMPDRKTILKLYDINDPQGPWEYNVDWEGDSLVLCESGYEIQETFLIRGEKYKHPVIYSIKLKDECDSYGITDTDADIWLKASIFPYVDEQTDENINLIDDLRNNLKEKYGQFTFTGSPGDYEILVEKKFNRNDVFPDNIKVIYNAVRSLNTIIHNEINALNDCAVKVNDLAKEPISKIDKINTKKIVVSDNKDKNISKNTAKKKNL